MNPSLGTAPAPAAPVFDVRTLSDEEAHAFGVAVASMSFAYDDLKAENAALRKRVAQRDSRIAFQKQTIIQLRRTQGADPDELLRRIDEALGETAAPARPVKATPLPRGTVLGAVRADRAGLRAGPLPPPRTPVAGGRAAAPQVPDVDPEHAEADCAGPGCDCGLCDGPPRPASKREPPRAWWLRQMGAALCGTVAIVALVVGVLFLVTGEYPSAVWTLGAAAVSAVVGVALRPRITPTRDGAR